MNVRLRQSLNEGAVASVEANPIVAIYRLLEKQEEWSGEPTQLLETLSGLVFRSGTP
jgi:hypothetical protein